MTRDLPSPGDTVIGSVFVTRGTTARERGPAMALLAGAAAAYIPGAGQYTAYIPGAGQYGAYIPGPGPTYRNRSVQDPDPLAGGA